MLEVGFISYIGKVFQRTCHDINNLTVMMIQAFIDQDWSMNAWIMKLNFPSLSRYYWFHKLLHQVLFVNFISWVMPRLFRCKESFPVVECKSSGRILFPNCGCGLFSDFIWSMISLRFYVAHRSYSHDNARLKRPPLSNFCWKGSGCTFQKVFTVSLHTILSGRPLKPRS